MQRPGTKAALITMLRRERDYWEALLAVVDEEDMVKPGVTGDWAFKDVVAHLTAWRKRTVARFRGAAQGGGPLPPEWPPELSDDDVQSVNAWIYQANRDRPVADILAESAQVWQQLQDAVETLPEADLLESGRFPGLGGRALGPEALYGSFGHLHEHAAMISDWLARRYDEA
jgi:hypothetical protein